jgi:hypothetical protein
LGRTANLERRSPAHRSGESSSVGNDHCDDKCVNDNDAATKNSIADDKEGTAHAEEHTVEARCSGGSGTGSPNVYRIAIDTAD